MPIPIEDRKDKPTQHTYKIHVRKSIFQNVRKKHYNSYSATIAGLGSTVYFTFSIATPLYQVLRHATYFNTE